MTVQVTFQYEPDDTDDNDPTGVTSEEFDRLTERLMVAHGAENIELKRVGVSSVLPPHGARQRKDA